MSVRVLLVALVALAGCREPSPAPPPPDLRIVRRLLDQGFRTASAPFTRRGHTEIGETRKLAVAAADAVVPEVSCVPASISKSPRRPCTVTVPRTVAPVQTLILETDSLPLLRAAAKGIRAHELPSRHDLHRIRRMVVRRHPIDEVPTTLVMPHWMVPGLRAWPVLGVGAWDLTSHPLQIPAGAVLTFATGIEEPAWYLDSAPVQFSIEARSPEGDVEVYRRTLDPARRPEDRRWFDERVSLAAVAGRTVSLRFRVRPLTVGDRRPQLPVWADPVLLAPAPPDSVPPPSIVLVSLDTLRAKSMSVYGCARETTPWFSEFARTSTRFAHAYTTFSNTFGSHISMLTGTYPARHDIRLAQRLSEDIPTLAERLRSAGYDTAAFTEDAMLDGSAGFDRGFADYWENTRIDSGTGDAPGTFARAIAWAAAHRAQPFFLFAHTYAVHSPYTPKPPYDTMFIDTASEQTSLEDAAGLLAYEQEIRQLDDEVARLVAALDALLPPERYVLVLTADHGEEFWEHGGLSHGQLYEEILHVPLFVRATGRLPAGRTITEQVSLIDIAPTLLDLANVERWGMDGLSLRPLLDGTATSLEREVILAECPKTIFNGRAWNFVARRADAKCFSFELASLDRCYDLEHDPNETNPLPPTVDTPLWTAAHLHGEAVFRSSKRRRAAPTRPPDPQRVEKLRALGYLE